MRRGGCRFSNEGRARRKRLHRASYRIRVRRKCGGSCRSDPKSGAVNVQADRLISRQVIAQVLVQKYTELGQTGWQTTRAEVERDVKDLFGGLFERFCRA